MGSNVTLMVMDIFHNFLSLNEPNDKIISQENSQHITIIPNQSGSFICSSDERSDSSSNSSSIVFQSLSQAPRDGSLSAKVPPRETQPVKDLVPTQERGQVVCPKMMRRIPVNYVPCVFLGQRAPVSTQSSKCPATGLDSSALLEEESSRSSIELNNNSCTDKDCQQWADKRTIKPSKEVGA